MLESEDKKLVTFSLKVKVMNTIPKIFGLLSQNNEQNQKTRYLRLKELESENLDKFFFFRIDSN